MSDLRRSTYMMNSGELIQDLLMWVKHVQREATAPLTILIKPHVLQRQFRVASTPTSMFLGGARKQGRHMKNIQFHTDSNWSSGMNLDGGELLISLLIDWLFDWFVDSFSDLQMLPNKLWDIISLASPGSGLGFQPVGHVWYSSSGTWPGDFLINSPSHCYWCLMIQSGFTPGLFWIVNPETIHPVMENPATIWKNLIASAYILFSCFSIFEHKYAISNKSANTKSVGIWKWKCLFYILDYMDKVV